MNVKVKAHDPVSMAKLMAMAMQTANFKLIFIPDQGTGEQLSLEHVV
jgi:hypothetical protein